MRAVLLAFAAASTLAAQFNLFLVDGNVERPVGGTQDVGTADRDVTLTARFRLRNASAAPASLRVLGVTGAGFSISAPPALPQTVAVGAAVDFAVLFRGSSEGTYSAALRSEGISVLLTASVVAQLTLALSTASGAQPLAPAATIAFPTAVRGSFSTVRLLVQNQTPRDQTIPRFVIQGDVQAADFGFTGDVPTGRVLHPGEEAPLDLVFKPSVAGPRRATLGFGQRTFTLSGAGDDPPLAPPRMTVTLAKPVSGAQGTVAVALDGVAHAAASGSLTLDFRPVQAGASDPTVQFSTGGQTVAFAVSPGDSLVTFAGQPVVRFQTGTTAGTLAITVRLGDFTDRQTFDIAPASIAIAAVETARTATGLELRITGFDNTRTAGALAFTFYDRAGAAIAPGAIRADGSESFRAYFQAAPLGGQFQLRAAFPVTGDASGIDAVEVEMANSAGAARSARTRIP